MRALPTSRVRVLRYRAWDGVKLKVVVLAPKEPGRLLPVVLAPHGRDGDAAHACAAFGDLAGIAQVLVVCPAGRGRLNSLHSWGNPGAIRDLARMRSLVTSELTDLSVDQRHLYVVGASMGGQEALLFASAYPQHVTGVVAMDAVADLVARYRQMRFLPAGARSQRRMRAEVGGAPSDVPAAYARRSPTRLVSHLASGCVRVFVWWSSHDWRVRAQSRTQSGRFLRKLVRAQPRGPVAEVVGRWQHEWPWHHSLAAAFDQLHLLPAHTHADAPPAPLLLLAHGTPGCR